MQERDLARTRKWIRGRGTAAGRRAEGERRRPPAPDWIIEKSIGDGPPASVHVGGCYAAPKWPRALGVTREQAREALYRQVPACPHCRPDAALGVLE
ncbi:DUF6233 domain-containing protein [Streptomyces sp. 135]|uniref:DUF6233 domain-containing protein n=1 Tax=Streptomyces sp. 135 TaxID=2838850 RepID=UPI001CBE40C9|nr:DUF6233 domain-containing protein [Streptomyces sp. 135]